MYVLFCKLSTTLFSWFSFPVQYYVYGNMKISYNIVPIRNYFSIFACARDSNNTVKRAVFIFTYNIKTILSKRNEYYPLWKIVALLRG